MTQTNFHIRAELPGNRYRDFQVGAETLEEARARAEGRILAMDGDRGTKFDWRGQVVFVTQPETSDEAI